MFNPYNCSGNLSMKMILIIGDVCGVYLWVGWGGGGAMCVGHILSQWSRIRSNAPSGVVT